jgi:hypothetical protein
MLKYNRAAKNLGLSPVSYYVKVALRVLIPALIAWLKEIRLYMATKHCLIRMVERPVRVKFFESSRGKIVNGDGCQFQES